MDDTERLRRERDLYLRLLDLGQQREIEPFLKDALMLVVEAVGARRGYLELREEHSQGERSHALAHGLDGEGLDTVKRAISRGIIAEAIATGRSVMTSSALLDPRFESRESVQAARIEAVLCAPIGASPPLGVLYLEGRAEPGPWPDADRALAERFALHLAPLAERLLERMIWARRSDPTAELRKKLRLEGIVGRSPAVANVLREAAVVAPVDVHVLITGESGTGKTQLARALHDNSPRAGGPFVALNCAAIPKDLFENELFGAHKGGHSAAAGHPVVGKVQAADGGTLFLDEIGELDLRSQPKLLTLLQSGEFYPLGASRPERSDVRVIAATNEDLDTSVREKRFREDLYFRLRVLPIRMPSLRERREDIAELADHFCRAAHERHRLPLLRLARSTLAALETAEWPGNVRQLANTIEAASIRAAAEAAEQIELRHLFPQEAAAAREPTEPVSFQEATRRFQRDLLARTLEDVEWNVTEAARVLDLSRAHAYNLIKAFELKRE